MLVKAGTGGSNPCCRDWIWHVYYELTHWGRVTQCVSKLTIIGSDNGLSPGRRQAIIRTNAGILLIRPLGTNFSEFLVEILIFSLKKMHLKISSGKWRPFCLGLNVLTHWPLRDVEVILQLYFENIFLWIGILSTSCVIGLRRGPQNLTNEKSTLVQVMLLCLTQCWPRSMSLQDITRAQMNS